MFIKIIQFIAVLLLSPLLFGIISRTKAFFAGRRGAPLLQLYYDLFKLFQKGAVYSTTTTWVFVAGPIIGLGAALAALTLVPFAGHPALFAFNGDLILFIYLLALARFFAVIAALDTGSSFEGMGASREIQFAAFAEPALFLSLAALARVTESLSLSSIFSHLAARPSAMAEPALFLIIGALLIVFLAENSRIPVDDPNTHLELTMIHEVMALDHGGVDLGYILYAAVIKFWVLGTLIAGIFFPGHWQGRPEGCVVFVLGMAALAFVVGIVESVLARLRLVKVPHFLIVSLALSILALAFTMR